MNKGDIVYILEGNRFLIATIIKRIEPYHGISYNMVNGDGYYVLVDYGHGNKWSQPFKTVNLVNWTKSFNRELRLNDILE